MDIFSIILVVLCVIGIIMSILTPFSTRIICYIFYHKKYMLWEEMINNFDKFTFKDCNNHTLHLKYGDTNFELIYFALHYDENSVGVFWKKNDYIDECVLSGFDTYHAKKMMKLVEDKFGDKLK